MIVYLFFFFFSSRRRHTRCYRDWSSDVCSSDLGPPHIPTCDSPVGAPALAKFQQLFRFWHVFFAVGDGPAFFHTQVVDGQDVRTSQAKDQKHFHGPGADAAYGNEAFDQFLIGELQSLIVCRHNARKSLFFPELLLWTIRLFSASAVGASAFAR